MTTRDPNVSGNKPTIKLHAILPGPNRKRTPARYRYRLIYSNPTTYAEGCISLWEVTGGRAPYQIAIVREENGELISHCSCADAVYRGEDRQHVCKHVLGFLQLSRQCTTTSSERENELPARAS